MFHEDLHTYTPVFFAGCVSFPTLKSALLSVTNLWMRMPLHYNITELFHPVYLCIFIYSGKAWHTTGICMVFWLCNAHMHESARFITYTRS